MVFTIKEGTGVPVHIYQGHVGVHENIKALYNKSGCK